MITTLVTDMRGRSIVLPAWRRKDESGNVDCDMNSKGGSKDTSKTSSIKGSLDQGTAVIVHTLQSTSSKSPPPQHMSALEMQVSQQQEHGEMQLEVRKTSSRRLSSDTSVTYASSSSSSVSSDSHVSDGRSEKDDSKTGADNRYTDEILARNMTISFKQKTGRDVKSTPSSLTIPFLDYLEKQMGKLNEESENCVATISPKCNNYMHLELSPIASQSAAAAEEKTIQCLRREMLRLHLALDTLKKNSHAWILLNSVLGDAREELNAVLEDQELVRSFKTVNTW
jgi:hypothetical protein